MSTPARTARRKIEMDAAELDFDYFADTTSLAGDGVLVDDFDNVAELVDLYAEIAEIEEALAELERPVAQVIALPTATPRPLGEVA
ncbi:hypothetical protein AMES_0374 [Amycolatopsis mediterranei S699]|uniref:Uncharacterized protein n=3 Tax=Amycolatopsis mediterranei TaxID=33910 RepID=A0A0H3CY07_AMYMU|nr:hypothetical protein [Amycolatopsis mediterranei]ABX56688.1 hypothetical protein amp112 [Amycolatopsis mediterranei]ADJ42196.1 hypothetical protein AMED_0374 [Amycolatopsis mediterranei U32]AEK38873.1 hypothetical protein RAM_01905 [Amycolatopsis mediterranei S699]AFO73910.1 hypothetical protein AMES_0374 [Amycolatopsis mediterranei S699]AGT81039.1 hypothetical protein B737_0375 [Amycolatopsis mediterranei RB]